LAPVASYGTYSPSTWPAYCVAMNFFKTGVAMSLVGSASAFTGVPVSPGATRSLRSSSYIAVEPQTAEPASTASTFTAAFSVGALAAVAVGLSSSRRTALRAGLPEGATYGPPTDGSQGQTVKWEDKSEYSGMVKDTYGKEIKGVDIPRPEDLLEDPRFPAFQGSVGGYFSKNTRERHAITWTAKEEMWFEMPTGGWALMNKGENLCYFRRKEQCISLGKGLRKYKMENYKIYRVKKDGQVVFLHPADGVFPEKVNKGRVQVNGRPFQCAMNVPQSFFKFTKFATKSYEVDPLTTMFIRAKYEALADTENLFPLPNPKFDDDGMVLSEADRKMLEERQKAKMKPASM